MSGKKLMILGAGLYQEPLIRKAREMGISTVVLSVPGNYPGFRIADRVLEINTADPPAVLAAARAEGIDAAVTTGTDVAVRSLGLVCDELGLPGISGSAARILSDKALMKDVWRGIVNTSPHRVVRSLSEGLSAAREIGFPVMVKACDVSGSRGITKVDEEEAFPAAWESACSASRTDHFVVEKFEEGIEIGVDALVVNHRAGLFMPHGKINASAGGIVVPAGHVFPLPMDAGVSRRAEEQLGRIICATGLNNCAVNCDMIVRPDGEISVLEAGGRCGATCIPELISIYTGIDYYRAIIDIAFGREPDLEPRRAVPCISRLIFSEVNGTVKSIDRFRIGELEGKLSGLRVDPEVGDTVHTMRNGTDRIGHVILETADVEEAEKAALEVRAAIAIEPSLAEESSLPRKKIMMLGGNFYQKTATLAAKRAGYHVVSVDYLPSNPAHAAADEYYNISTVDREQVLAKARELGIDGIVSYASDVSAPTAAYVAGNLRLPTNPLSSVWLLTHKNLFRRFQAENGFPHPRFGCFSDRDRASAFAREIGTRVIVKPTDSSGSKGVGLALPGPEFDAAWEEARSYARSGEIMVEEFLDHEGFRIDGDIFVDGGRIVFRGLCDQHHDNAVSRFTPTGHSFPSCQDRKYQDEAMRQVQGMIDLLGLSIGAFNLEYIVRADGTVYIMELGPRSGGNLISDAIREACGADLALAVVRQAVGDPPGLPAAARAYRYTSSYILHSASDGIFRGLEVDPGFVRHILLQKLFVEEGDPVSRFRNASFAVGAMILAFDDAGGMTDALQHIDRYVRVIVE